MATKINTLGTEISELTQKNRQAGIRAPILLLEGFLEADELPLIDRHRLWTVLASPWQLDALARSAPDGYTFGITTQSSVWGGRVLYRNVKYDNDRDFVPLSMLPVGPLVMAVPTAMPVSSTSVPTMLSTR